MMAPDRPTSAGRHRALVSLLRVAQVVTGTITVVLTFRE